MEQIQNLRKMVNDDIQGTVNGIIQDITNMNFGEAKNLVYRLQGQLNFLEGAMIQVNDELHDIIEMILKMKIEECEGFDKGWSYMLEGLEKKEAKMFNKKMNQLIVRELQENM